MDHMALAKARGRRKVPMDRNLGVIRGFPAVDPRAQAQASVLGHYKMRENHSRVCVSRISDPQPPLSASPEMAALARSMGFHEALPCLERICGALGGYSLYAVVPLAGGSGCVQAARASVPELGRATVPELARISNMSMSGHVQPFGSGSQELVWKALLQRCVPDAISASSSGAASVELVRKGLKLMVPDCLSASSSGSIFSRLNVICLGAGAGLLLIQSNQKRDDNKDFIEPEQQGPEDKDPLKHILRLVKSVVAKFNKFPVPDIKEPMGLIKLLEDQLGKKATLLLISAGGVVKECFKDFYLFFLTGAAFFSLQISIVDGYKIVRMAIDDERMEIQHKLAAYARALARKPEDDSDADKVVSYCVYDLETQKYTQVMLLLRKDDEDAIRVMLADLEKQQPCLPMVQRPGMRVLMRSYEEAALRSMIHQLIQRSQLPLIKYPRGGFPVSVGPEDPAVRKILQEIANNMAALRKSEMARATKPEHAAVKVPVATPSKVSNVSKVQPTKPFKAVKPKPGKYVATPGRHAGNASIPSQEKQSAAAEDAPGPAQGNAPAPSSSPGPAQGNAPAPSSSPGPAQENAPAPSSSPGPAQENAPAPSSSSPGNDDPK